MTVAELVDVLEILPPGLEVECYFTYPDGGQEPFPVEVVRLSVDESGTITRAVIDC